MGEQQPFLSERFDLNFFLKTGQGKQLLDTHKPFVAKGEILQGFKGRCFEVRESQLTDEELESVTDLDGTKNNVWKKRFQRLESAHMRKAEEYSNRRGMLRGRQNEIFEASERRQKLGLPMSAADTQEIEELDTRMERLAALKEQQGATYAKKEMEPVVEPTKEQRRVQALCGAESPLEHQNPENWRRGHQVGCKKCRDMK